MHLSTPAYVAAIAYLVLVIIILFSPSSVVMQGETPNKPPTLSDKIINVILMLIPVVLSVYSINCFIVGGCVVWGWINAVFILLWVLLFVLVLTLSVKQNVRCQGLPNTRALEVCINNISQYA